MKKLWNFSEKLSGKTGIKMTSIFLFFNMAVWGAAAFAASAVIDAVNILSSIDSFDIYFIIIGYAIVFPGFFGGSFYVMKNE